MENNELSLKLKFKYSEIVELWQDFCNSHNELYQHTLTEYEALLDSRLDDLDALISDKEIIIAAIYGLDEKRQDLIDEISGLCGTKFDKLKEIFPIVQKLNLDPNRSLEKYNDLLLDTVAKIQEQNKKNQIFLNKAILSLQDLKTQFKGKKSFNTYNSKGNTLNP